MRRNIILFLIFFFATRTVLGVLAQTCATYPWSRNSNTLVYFCNRGTIQDVTSNSVWFYDINNNAFQYITPTNPTSFNCFSPSLVNDTLYCLYANDGSGSTDIYSFNLYTLNGWNLIGANIGFMLTPCFPLLLFTLACWFIVS